ncbi:alanine racemase [Kerstersia gyiorum]|jgi:alanine racemase|nr:alanine racemase [Kerstersia gyiorum]AZV92737.1 alanine racemase [Bordetella sp. J329]MCP1633973.1 alanine racemase [Kerstersia gyiorum]MCP1637367.1 alanine racemase [Kerstersia gyiorum]MCP1671840.1 alanine racemase [Kerstersia gyiorum]MCP1679827.1 alanine racemase [Kerstersia gyiorum]
MRPSFALIDLDALRHNYRVAKHLHGGKALAVLKANAYGHGAVRCAQALAAEADGYAVAFLEEALVLREAGIRHPILLLEGIFDADDLQLAQGHDLWMVVHQESQLRLIEDAARAATGAAALHVWLKIDTGMHRAGFAPEQADAVHARLRACRNVGDITLISHLAQADEPDQPATLRQIAQFQAVAQRLGCARSLSNSAATLAWPQAHCEWARPGILLYGADPMPEASHGLRPVMSLESQVFATRILQPGEALGYGARFVADQPTRIGLVAIGYADGYPRTAPNGTPVAVDGKPTRLVGRVSMDMLTIDLSDLPEAGIGSAVQLWGPLVDINQVAAGAGTISYELLCNVKRVPMIYKD